MNRHEPIIENQSNLLTVRGISLRLKMLAVGLGVAVLLGGLIATAMGMAKAVTALVMLALGGICVSVIWTSIKLPLLPVLQIALIATFWFRLEINLFPIIKQGHETPFGLLVSLKLIVSIILLIAFIYGSQRKETGAQVWPASFSWMAILLCFLCVLSVLYGVETRAGLYALWNLAAMLLIGFVVAANFGSERMLRRMLLCTAIGILLNAGLGLLQYLEIFNGWELLGAQTGERLMKMPGTEVSRASGLLEAANSFGWALATFCPVVIAPVLLAKEALRKWEQWLCTAAFLASVLALLLTMSRGSWAAFAVALPVLAVFVLTALSWRERWRMLVRMAGVFVVMVALSTPFMQVFITRLTQDDEGSAESRVPLMEVAAAMIQAHPVLGVGLSSYEAVMRRFDETDSFITEHFPYPVHNMFLHIAAEAGIPALSCLLMLIGISLHCGWKVWRTDNPRQALPRALAVGLMVGVLSFLITGLKEPGTFDSGQLNTVFLLCGLLIATERAGQIETAGALEAAENRR